MINGEQQRLEERQLILKEIESIVYVLNNLNTVEQFLLIWHVYFQCASLTNALLLKSSENEANISS